MHAITPSSFYGTCPTGLDEIRRIRLSRLMDAPTDAKLLKEKKSSRNRSESKSRSRSRKRAPKPVQLFYGVSHGIRQPSKSQRKLQKRNKEKKLIKKRLSIRENIKEKFDFSRTPYALPKKHRIALTEDNSQKRKFFKTTVITNEPHVEKSNESKVVKEFEDELMNEICNDNAVDYGTSSIVSNIISNTDWFEDDECTKPQMTRKEADELANETSTHTMSYIVPMEMASEDTIYVPMLFPGSENSESGSSENTESVCSENSENVMSENTSPIRDSPKKYFPLFTSPGAKLKVLSDLTNKPKKTNNILIKAAAPNNQYQIDAGQKVIGPRECQKCGMVYDIGDPVDEKRHRMFHKKMTELKYKCTKSENVVMNNGLDRIVLVQDKDSKAKIQKVQWILKQTEEDIGSGYTLGRDWKAFIYVRNDNVLGCLIAESDITANRVAQYDEIMLLSEDTFPVLCGINRIWVKHDFRGQKIGTSLINCLRKNFVYGQYLQIDDIAFSVTTPDGNEFAKKITGRQDYLTYSRVN